MRKEQLFVLSFFVIECIWSQLKLFSKCFRSSSSMTTVLENFNRLKNKWTDLFNELSSIPLAVLEEPEAQGKWSINQVLVHLIEAEKNGIRYIQKKMQSDEGFKQDNWNSRFRFWLLCALLRLPLKFKKPQILPEPSNEIDFDNIQEMVCEAHNEIEMFLKIFPNDLVKKQIFKHPIAGRLPLNNSLEFLHLHFDHHMRQVQRILNVKPNE